MRIQKTKTDTKENPCTVFARPGLSPGIGESGAARRTFSLVCLPYHTTDILARAPSIIDFHDIGQRKVWRHDGE